MTESRLHELEIKEFFRQPTQYIRALRGGKVPLSYLKYRPSARGERAFRVCTHQGPTSQIFLALHQNDRYH